MTEELVLLVGSMGSGKTTAADILVKRHNYKQDIFAGPLKKFALTLGFTRKQIHGTQAQKAQKNEFWGISGRKFMQKFGTEICRDTLPKIIPKMDLNGRTLWARVMEHKILKHKRFVISDGRFDDEAQLVRQNGGLVIGLQRTLNDSEQTTEDLKHSSEQPNIKPDIIIDNNDSLDALEAHLLEAIQAHFGKLSPVQEKLQSVCTSAKADLDEDETESDLEQEEESVPIPAPKRKNKKQRVH